MLKNIETSKILIKIFYLATEYFVLKIHQKIEQRLVQDPAKHLRWSFFASIVWDTLVFSKRV